MAIDAGDAWNRGTAIMGEVERVNQVRFKLLDTETGKELPLTTDEVQADFFLAEKYLRERDKVDSIDYRRNSFESV